MRHRVAGYHLKRDKGHRRALFRNLITDLFRYERIETTEAKAKAIRAEAEKLITRAKRGLPDRLVELANDGDGVKLKALVGERNAERLIALADNDQSDALQTLAGQLALHARRHLMRTVSDQAVVDKLIHEIAPDYADRPGGYTRLVKLGPRLGDAAPMVYLELVE
jgi:large subunit ribosomal protein L17